METERRYYTVQWITKNYNRIVMLFPILYNKSSARMLFYTKVMVHVSIATAKITHNSKLRSAENKHRNLRCGNGN